MSRNVEISFLINGSIISRREALEEEKRRSIIALKKLNIEDDTEDILEIRRTLVERKLKLGHQELENICKKDVYKSSKLVGLMRAMSFGRVKPCQVEVFANGISAKEFVTWFEQINEIADEKTLLAAHPEHYIINNTPDGRQLIYETNGGSPFIASFTIDFTDKEDALKQSLQGYPYNISGKAINKKGKKVGGSMHQFQDTENGMHGILSIDFPYLILNSVMEGHKMHLAIEFSNWIEMAAQSLE